MHVTLPICGDFNTDFERDSPQTEELKMFCDVENLFPCTLSSRFDISHTYENSNGARSFIDHFIISRNFSDFVRSLYTYDTINNSSDHVAVICDFKIVVEYIDVTVTENNCQTPWYKANINDIERYKCALDGL
jgi:patatin-like phospholipase/acyl hydrolase